MDDGWADLVVVLPRDPLAVEGVHGGKDGATEPDRVLASGLVVDMDVVLGALHLVQFVPKTPRESIKQTISS